MDLINFSESDLPELGALQPPGWRDITTAFRFYLSTAGSAAVKAVVDGALAGVGASVRFAGTGWVGHIIVHQSFRRRGVGAAIVSHLVTGLQDAGCETVSLVATDDGYPLYRKLGFADQGEYIIFERPDASVQSPEVQPSAGAGPPGASQPAVAVARPGDAEAILRIDAEATGEDRRSLRSALLTGALVCSEEGVITGFHSPELGEGFIAALTPQAGRTLLLGKLHRAGRAAMPAANTAAVELVSDYGFRELRRPRRMVLGNPVQWRPTSIWSRAGGNLG